MITGRLAWEGQYDGVNYRVVAPEEQGVLDFVVLEDDGTGRWPATDDRTAYRVLCRMMSDKAREGNLRLGQPPRSLGYDFTITISGSAKEVAGPGYAEQALAKVRRKLESVGSSVVYSLETTVDLRHAQCRADVSGELAIAAGLEGSTGKG